ncbi:TBC domain-containing kinase, putative [Babesia ovis]|uniref:TBC domain-containing kinase, putative n=1 Tax=Babesia ovis TaxID=5869 RepID=A0A9W5TCC4_BABOV|nr:TBC domain-containing kinase, putative [Babesia ovis]
MGEKDDHETRQEPEVTVIFSSLGLGIERIVLPTSIPKDKGMVDVSIHSDLNTFLRIHSFIGDCVKGAVAEAFQVLKTLWHPNVCCYTDMLRIGEGVYALVSEQYSVTLDDYIQQCGSCAEALPERKQIPDIDFNAVLYHIVAGVQYLHAHGIEHGSLGLHNVFIHGDGSVKIGCYAGEYLRRVALETGGLLKYGLTAGCDRETDCTLEDVQGPIGFHDDIYRLCYTAPEFIKCGPVNWLENLKNDTWALGITCLQMIPGIIARSELVKNTNITLVSHQLYLEMAQLVQCPRNITVVQDAFTLTSSIIDVVASNINKRNDTSIIGLDLIGMCLDILGITPSDEIKTATDDMIITLVDKLLDADSSIQLSTKWQDVNEHERANTKQDTSDVGDGLHGYSLATSKRALVKTVEVLIDWFTGKSIIEDLLPFVGIDLVKGTCDENNERHPDVQLVYLIFNICTQCLIIDPSQRANTIDLLNLLNRIVPSADSAKVDQLYSWKVISDKQMGVDPVLGIRMPFTEFLNRSYRKRYINIKSFGCLPLHVDDLFYFWRLMGNNPLDVIENIEYASGGHRWHYTKHFILLDELIKTAKQADLFPMIIEHQIRPTCTYARQFTYLYQWIRIRRFDMLLCNGFDSKQQVSTEAQLDVPPLLRKYIWCLILDIDVPFRPPMSDIEYHGDIPQSVETDILKLFRRFDNDLLHSERALKMMAMVGNAIQKAYALESLPSSIYVTCVPLLILYYDFGEVFLDVVLKIFDKYLKHYYISSGSFVHNDLDEFNTMLKFFDPEVAVHLQRIGAFADSFALLWFMSLFAETTSYQQLYVLWDTILNFPRSYVKYVAVGIIHSARQGILEATTAPQAISYISSLTDVVNIPMLNALCMHLYNTWDLLLFSTEVVKPRTFTKSISIQEATPVSDLVPISKDTVRSDATTVENITFTFNTEMYPKHRCFKLTLRQFAELLDTCFIVDLRPIDSYKTGRLPNSCHIDRFFTCLEKGSDAAINALVNEVVNANIPKSSDAYPNKVRKKAQLLKNYDALLGGHKKWSQERLKEANILLAAGDGSELDREMEAVQRLIFDFHVPHLCYYRINTDDWPKFFTISQI